MTSQFGKATYISNPNYDGHVSDFRRTFSVSGNISHAELKVTGLGWFSSYVNGKRTDEQYFKPLVSDYGERNFDGVKFFKPKSGTKRVYYHKFDVTALLKNGDNELKFLVADGWYAHREKQVEGDFSYGDPVLIYELKYTEDGKEHAVFSDESTVVANLNLRATLFLGETRDYREHGMEFVPSVKGIAPGGELTLTPMSCDRILRYIEPIAVDERGEKRIYDFGVNHSGFLRGTLCGKRGDVVTVRYSEELDEGGDIDHVSTSWGTQIQTDSYTLSGGADEIETEFTYHGYRYAEVTAPAGTEIDIRSAEVNAALSDAGTFECSHPTLNGIAELYRRTQLSNMHGGVPTDCPHRERRGFTGDGQVTAAAAMYLFDAEKFYRKWMRDVIDSQQSSGYVPHTAPYSGGGGGYGWGYAVCRVPEVLYEFTGDKQIIREALPAVEKWVNYMNSKHVGDFVLHEEEDSWSLGDWFCADRVEIDAGYVCTCFFLKSVRTLMKFRRVDDKSVGDLIELENRIAAAIRARYYDENTGSYAGGIQGADALALELGLYKEGEEQKLRRNLAARYRSKGHLDTGIFCTVPLLEQLTLGGETDLVYRMLTSTEYPSFGYMISRGATTLWECWEEKISPSFRLADGQWRQGYPVSHNHPMFGAVCSFLYEYVAGLDMRVYGESRTVKIEPRFIAQVPRCEASRITQTGVVKVRYALSGDTLTARISVPRGVKAEVRLPLAENPEFTLGEGEHKIDGKIMISKVEKQQII